MTNTELLNARLQASGLKKSFIAEKMSLSVPQLKKKFENEVEFKVSEVFKLCEILQITDAAERDAIFFAQNVD